MELIFTGNVVKSKKFCPDPVVKYGIPDYADTIKNPSVKGTQAWQQWWEEQIDRCINGYETGGIFITGRYYKFLNFDVVSTVGKGNHPPGFIDFQFDFFNLVEYAKQEFWGLIGLKARRKGLSEMAVSVMDHGFRFSNGYHAGICAGLQEHTDDFVAKFKRGLYTKPNELMIRTLEENNEKIVSGWSEQNANLQWVDKGSLNTIYTATMKTNPNPFKGKYLDDAVFEESGEFELLEKGYNATKPCFMDGKLMVGTAYVYGTGGNMTKGSKAFAEMWAEAKEFRLIKFFVPATKMYFPCVSGYKDKFEKLQEDVPNLEKKYQDHERIGMDDEKRAEEIIQADRAELKKKKNQQAYWDNLQNYPLNAKEAFMKFSGNNFDTESLNNRRFELDSMPKYPYQVYELSWKRDEKGVLLDPLQVHAEPMEESNVEVYDNRHLIMIHKMPRLEFQNLDIAGIDGYNQDVTLTSKSLGAMVIYRRNHDHSFERELPVALVRYRPKMKEIFFDTCLMAAVMYGLEGSVLCDAGSDLVIQHFQNAGCSRFLALRPLEFDSDGGEQVHRFGVKFTSYSKPRAIGVMQKEIITNIHKCAFPQIVDGCLDYDVSAKESDWDEVDAYMIAKMLDIDMAQTRKASKKDDENDKSYDMPYWVEDDNGNLRDISLVNKNVGKNEGDLFIRMMKAGAFNR